MVVFIIHPSAHAQYHHLVTAHAARGDTVYFLCQRVLERVAGVHYLEYTLPRPPASRSAEARWSAEFQTATLRAAQVAGLCEALLAQGVVPEIIYGHCGWGDLLFVKDVFPDQPLVCYIEYYYHSRGFDLGFDPEFDPIFIEPKLLQARNAAIALTALRADLNTTPTPWQQRILPAALRADTRVLHEGIDTAAAAPDEAATFTVPGTGLQFSARDRLITYVSRSLEPYRGFPTFMRALPAVLQRFPDAQVLIAGAEGTSYGRALPAGNSYKTTLLAELEGQLDLNRVHFCGTLPREAFLDLLKVSSAHVYLTYPLFVSWSCLEALSAGCLVIGSRTGPVTDVIEHGKNGLLVDFFNPQELSATLIDALQRPKSFNSLRKAARRQAVARFDLHRRCLPEWLALSDSLGKLS